MTDVDLERLTFDAGAALRIQGLGLDFDLLTSSLCHKPTHVHRAGDRVGLNRTYPTDMWMLSSPLDKKEPLEAHLQWLSQALLPNAPFIRTLDGAIRADIYCNQGCYTEQSSVILSSQVLELFIALGTALQISLFFLPYEPMKQEELPDALNQIEDRIGSTLSPEDMRLLHDEILGKNYTFDEVVAVGKRLFESGSK